MTADQLTRLTLQARLAMLAYGRTVLDSIIHLLRRQQFATLSFVPHLGSTLAPSRLLPRRFGRPTRISRRWQRAVGGIDTQSFFQVLHPLLGSQSESLLALPPPSKHAHLAEQCTIARAKVLAAFTNLSCFAAPSAHSRLLVRKLFGIKWTEQLRIDNLTNT